MVWQSLLDKYQDNRGLAGRYIEKNLNFTPLQKTNTNNLTLFFGTFDYSLKAIQALKINNLEDFLFCHLALRGLDMHTRKLFEESRDQKSIPKFSELIDFVNNQIKVLEHTFPSAVAEKSKSNHIYKGNTNRYEPRPSSFKAVLTSTTRPLSCPHCQQNHMIYGCEHFRKMSVDERIKRVNDLQLCVNCLKLNHIVANCKSTITCGVCALPHHYLLHKDNGRARGAYTAAVPKQSSAHLSHSNTQQALASSHYVSDSQATQHARLCIDEKPYGVVLGTTRTNILDVNGQYQDCRAVIDSGAQSSFITTECAQRLGLPRKQCPFSIAGLGGELLKIKG